VARARPLADDPVVGAVAEVVEAVAEPPGREHGWQLFSAPLNSADFKRPSNSST
jgi:hypothetical protein